MRLPGTCGRIRLPALCIRLFNMKNVTGILLLAGVIAAIAGALYLVFVGASCEAPFSYSQAVYPNCVNIFHPLWALFISCVAFAILCGILFASLQDR